jgi:5-formyltetrahydrofolate cyclo-ligase
MDLYNNKVYIRKSVIEKRDSITIDIKKEWDERILKKLIDNKSYEDSLVLFTFVSFGSEVDTHKIISYALNDGKIVYVPKIKSKDKGIEIFRINTLSDLKPGYFNILEPLENCPVGNIKDIDLILMPGIAFDRNGGRIGYGAGFYDRFLTNINSDVPKLALAYQFQVLDEVPITEFDVKIDGIISNKELITVY